jgi:hypothetical protein
MGCGCGINRAPHAADHADRRRSKSRLHPDRARDLLGTMAYAMMGGIIVGTMLTLLFLPALYVAWFRIKEPESAPDHHREKPNSPGIMSTLLSMHFHRGRRNTSPPKLEVLLRCRPVWSACARLHDGKIEVRGKT